MTIKKRIILSGGFAFALALAFIAGCSNKNDPISQAEKGEKNTPSIAEVKAIAEEGCLGEDRHLHK
ncbi:MAG: hypothetical protein ABSG53_24150 [Thermoguttaceae bacterium]|jgi:hypothetical protein